MLEKVSSLSFWSQIYKPFFCTSVRWSVHPSARRPSHFPCAPRPSLPSPLPTGLRLRNPCIRPCLTGFCVEPFLNSPVMQFETNLRIYRYKKSKYSQRIYLPSLGRMRMSTASCNSKSPIIVFPGWIHGPLTVYIIMTNHFFTDEKRIKLSVSNILSWQLLFLVCFFFSRYSFFFLASPSNFQECVLACTGASHDSDSTRGLG